MPLFTAPSTGPHATVLARSALPPAVLMPLVAERPLPAMFTGWGPFPSVRRVEAQDGAWDAAGKTRTLRLADGGSVVETLRRFDAGRGFDYELTGFTDVFDRLVRGVRGEWSFTPDGAGTLVRWTWEFAARPGRRAVMALVVGPLWRRYMQRMLTTTVRTLTREARATP